MSLLLFAGKPLMLSLFVRYIVILLFSLGISACVDSSNQTTLVDSAPATEAQESDISTRVNDDIYDLSKKAVDLIAQGQYIEALPFAQQALEKAEHYPKQTTQFSYSLKNLALIQTELARYQQAEVLYSRALAIQERAMGADSIDIGRTLNDLGLLQKKNESIKKLK